MDPDPHCFGSAEFGSADSGRQNDTQKKKKSEEMYCFEVLDGLF